MTDFHSEKQWKEEELERAAEERRWADVHPLIAFTYRSVDSKEPLMKLIAELIKQRVLK